MTETGWYAIKQNNQPTNLKGILVRALLLLLLLLLLLFTPSEFFTSVLADGF